MWKSFYIGTTRGHQYQRVEVGEQQHALLRMCLGRVGTPDVEVLTRELQEMSAEDILTQQDHLRSRLQLMLQARRQARQEHRQARLRHLRQARRQDRAEATCHRSWKHNLYGEQRTRWKGNEMKVGFLPSEPLPPPVVAAARREWNAVEQAAIRQCYARELFQRLADRSLAEAQAVWDEIIATDIAAPSRAAETGLEYLRSIADAQAI